MNLSVLELRRRPSRFALATVVLSLIMTLILFLGGLLDGLFVNSSGAFSATDDQVYTFSASSKSSVLRSRIDPETRNQIEDVEGVSELNSLSISLTTANLSSDSNVDNTFDVALIGYERESGNIPTPPETNSAIADASLNADGVEQGSTVYVGQARTPIVITGFADQSNYLNQQSLWMNRETWNEVVRNNRPDNILGDGVVQVLAATVNSNTSADAVAADIDKATGNATTSLNENEAIQAIPGLSEQQSTFNQIIYTTMAVAALVIALFFSLLTLERMSLYGVLKALGSSTPKLLVGVVLQAVLVGTAALLVGGLIVFAAGVALPSSVPLQLSPSRFVTSAIGLYVSAIFGSVTSFRRIVRIDPVSAIG